MPIYHSMSIGQAGYEFNAPSGAPPDSGCALVAGSGSGQSYNLGWSARPVLIEPAVAEGSVNDYLSPEGWKTIPSASVAVGDITGMGTGVAAFLATPSSANLATAVTDETGSGALVFANTPTLVTPNIGAATGSSLAVTGSISTPVLNSGSVGLIINPGTTGIVYLQQPSVNPSLILLSTAFGPALTLSGNTTNGLVQSNPTRPLILNSTAGTNVVVGGVVADADAKFGVISDSTSKVVTKFKGIASQTANLTEWQDSAGTVLASVGANGAITAVNVSATNTLSFSLDCAATGAKNIYLLVPFACTINSWTLVADAVGSLVVDIWKDTYANFPPVNADSIVAAAKPSLSAQQTATSSTLTGWTTSVAAGDYIEVEIESVSTIAKAVLTLNVTRV